MSLRQTIAAAAARLAANPELHADAYRDAELLLLHTLSLQRTALFTDPNRNPTITEQTAYDRAIDRRRTGEPIQYITGEQEFYGLKLRVTPAVLIPRPETELLVEAVLERLPPAGALRVLDIGTGSGAIAIALAAHRPEAQITALDLSPGALAVARENAATHQLSGRIRLLESDLLSAVANEPPFDAIVSNPPYVPEADRAALHSQVRDHEPASALFAGPDGLGIYSSLIPQARAALTPGGLLALEFGHGQREALAALLREWNEVEFLNDLQQIPRVALACRP
ncbi:MAG TPA: peptide chain release factor N(5)-glutamine methyltransferase [Granulicella sp.]|jgi:release factor glutamine methyltransferase|nr:peptide chain release factor N(5)-glutamine methyltransferase [Granulicella sp.]